MSPPQRPRTRRREQQRAAHKQVALTRRQAALLPGGTAQNPIDVGASSVVDVRARATPCVHCGGELAFCGEIAQASDRGVLRAIDLQCRRCHLPIRLWFRVVSDQPS